LISAKYTEIRQSEPFVVRLAQATPLGKRAFRSAGKRGEIVMSQPPFLLDLLVTTYRLYR
ncbi:hypothetical protein CSV80_13780, partial [Sporosarcina sp. P12(2017)]